MQAPRTTLIDVKIVMTLMVRDEADILSPMLEHHVRQGVDHFIVTDNGSQDGTLEILKAFEAQGKLTFYSDLVQRKQQSETVTRMAREAATRFNATWVINADADEFWVAEDPSLTVREALSRIPTSFRSFTVPVFDMTGVPAISGSGLGRLVYRDVRPVEEIRRLGLHGHATHDSVHVGDPDVVVSQGNHYVSIESLGQPGAGRGLEVLHFPWRSWSQFSAKVERSGRAYERSDKTPSPNHHGMRDYKRLRDGSLYWFYLARHPSLDDLATDGGKFFRRDDRIAVQFEDPVADVLASNQELAFVKKIVPIMARLEESQAQNLLFLEELNTIRAENTDQQNRILQLEAEIQAIRNSRTMRLAAAVKKTLHLE